MGGWGRSRCGLERRILRSRRGWCGGGRILGLLCSRSRRLQRSRGRGHLGGDLGGGSGGFSGIGGIEGGLNPQALPIGCIIGSAVARLAYC